MQELLPHYERELAFIRGRAKEFAQRYPKIAGRLMLAADVSDDPHVERMIESFALLAARIHKRLDDDFPLFTETFLDVLYPHYLRPFPSCSIAQFDVGTAQAQMTSGISIPRGTYVSARPIRGVACKFRTAYEVKLLPLTMSAVSYRGSLIAPEGTRLPASATTAISLQLKLTGQQSSWAALGSSLRVYLSGEPSQVSAVREVLAANALAVAVQTSPYGPWQGPFSSLPRLAGFADDEALIDFDARSHPAYRLITEYFAFPEKFNFVDLPLPSEAIAAAGNTDTITLHILLGGVRSDSDESRLIETIDTKNFLLGCTPVVNLFNQRADPIRITQRSTSYPVLADSRRAYGYEVYSINRVFRVQQTPNGESIAEFRPFYSLRHDEIPTEGEVGQSGGRYWYAHRDESVAEASPGYETELSIVDVNFDPAAPQIDTLSLEISATNRDMPSQLPIGVAGGDLFLEGGTVAREIRLLRKPTLAYRFERGRGAMWRLISHLSLNHLSLTAGGIDALKEMLRLYDLPRSATTQRQIDGLVAIDHRPATAWLPGNPFATFVRGMEVRVTVTEENFVGAGLRLFAQLLDHFFALYVHANSFTQLTILSARTQQEILKCPPRNGDGPLA